MTFHPDQIVTNEDWRKQHEGHEIIEDIEIFPFISSKAEKRMHYWICKTCDKRHLHNMETVET